MYTELSQFTLKQRRNLNIIMKALYNHNITYRWGYPSKLTVTKDGASFIIKSLNKGLALLRSWKILVEPPNSATPASNTKRVTQNGS